MIFSTHRWQFLNCFIFFPRTGSFYAVAVAAHQQTYGGIYLSSDNGNSWTLLPAADQTLSWQSVTIDSTGKTCAISIMCALNMNIRKVSILLSPCPV